MSTDFSGILPEEVEQEVKDAAEISMGTEISEEDRLNVTYLCEQVNPMLCLLYTRGQKYYNTLYYTCPTGVTYNFHLFCKHMHLSFKSICNKEHNG